MTMIQPLRSCGSIPTRWTALVDRDCPLPEYPRPQLVRDRWQNLNGMWHYAITDRQTERVTVWDGTICVPFPLESCLSGVQRPLLPDQKLWYQRSFTIPKNWSDQNIILHFGAVDWEAEVWLNGQRLGMHRGGYLPFSFNITSFIRADENELIVGVTDPTDSGLQQRGKQCLNPHAIWYSAVSGIWQTVWLEPVPEHPIQSLQTHIDFDNRCIAVRIRDAEMTRSDRLRVTIYDGEKILRSVEGSPLESIKIPAQECADWSPENPRLYDMKVELLHGAEVKDTVTSYIAFRKIRLTSGKNGHSFVELNGKPIFLHGPLDQGYWPDGLYTAPMDAALQFDIQLAKDLGFNMIRKHVKVEPLRWYYHCDRLGMLVWQDMPNGGRAANEVETILGMHFGYRPLDDRNYQRTGRGATTNRMEFEAELFDMITLLRDHPCVIGWTPFNEGWGQFDARRIGAQIQQIDPERLVDHASGWYDQSGDQFDSRHIYFTRLYRPRKDHRPFFLTEFGGYGRVVEEHCWDASKKFGYRFFPTAARLTQAYTDLIDQELIPLLEHGLIGAVYTELTDVEIEMNGFLTYDRSLMKMDTAAIQSCHKRLMDRFGDQITQIV